MTTLPCNTPDKLQFRSQAEAARFQRTRQVPNGHKDRNYPYLCQCGEHWHLTHHTPGVQREIIAHRPGAAVIAASHSFEAFEVRHLLIGDEPWFVAADIARALGYRDAHNLARRIDPEDRGTRSVSTPGGPQDMGLISEPGLYAAILGSQVPYAQKFKRWLTHEVLPAIRKTGRYDTSIALPDRKTLAQWVVDAETRAEVAESKVIELTPAASAWNELADAAGDYSVADAAKVLSRDPNINTGERRLFKFMQSISWIFRRDGNWHVYQSQLQCGRLIEKVGKPFWHESRGEMVAGAPTVRITPKGLQELHRRLGGRGDSQIALAATS